MTYPHSANNKHPSLSTYLWRFFTGQHLDGRKRTNATWFKRGTIPSHHVNWWTSKPIFHRMLWRWACVFVPAAWIVAYSFSPVYGINLTVIITLCALPYLFHHGTMRVINLLPRRTVVYVTDNIRTEDVQIEDDVTIPELEHPQSDDDLQDLLDRSIDDIPADDRRRRRS